jgi:predicted NUDIX family phosphoesterase
MEEVLVVNREDIEEFLQKPGIITREMPEIMDIILHQHFFAPREKAEYDKKLKQIIPYVLIRQKDRFFLLRRLNKQTETRLHDRLSLGIGGHINPMEDVAPGCSLITAGMERELHEEVFVEKVGSLRCVGLINDDTDEVGQYHLGVVYLLEAEGEVQVLEVEKMEGKWTSVSELITLQHQLETWSQIAFQELIQPLVV